MEINTFSVYSAISTNNDLNAIDVEKAIALVDSLDDLSDAREAKKQIKSFFGECLSTEYSLGSNNFCRIFDETRYYKIKINIEEEIMIYYFEK